MSETIIVTQPNETIVVSAPVTLITSDALNLPKSVAFDASDFAAGELDIGLIQTGRRVFAVIVEISTAFSAGATCTIGDDDAEGRLVVAATCALQQTEEYWISNNVLYATATMLKLFFSGTPATGAGTVTVYSL